MKWRRLLDSAKVNVPAGSKSPTRQNQRYGDGA
jgi:hypothetical protein